LTTVQTFLIFLLAHIAGDFYFQSRGLAELKNKTWRGLLYHSLLYGVAFLGTLLVAKPSLPALAVIIIGHGLIDWLKYSYLHRDDPKKKEDKRLLREEAPWLFLLDQGLHLLLIYLAARQWPGCGLQAWFPAQGFNALRWILLLALVGKPTNISFKRVFTRYANYRSQSTTVEGAGSLIGFFERALTIIFIHLGQYSALGFVMAAKSLARFKLLSEDQGFAEYYLIGTLYSILFALLAYLLVFKLLA
jgi:hypothetical protein